MWHDEFCEVQRSQMIPTKCCECEMEKVYLREYAKDVVKEVENEVSKKCGVDTSSIKIEKITKN